MPIMAYVPSGALLMAAIGFASCNKDENSSNREVERRIIGKWKSFIVNDEFCPTNLRSVNTYTITGMKYVSHSKHPESKGGWMWSNNVPYK